MINREHNHGTQNIKSFRQRVIKGPTRQSNTFTQQPHSLVSLAFSLSNSLNPLFFFFLYPHQTYKHTHPSSSYPFFIHPHPHTTHAHNNNNNNNFHTHTHTLQNHHHRERWERVHRRTQMKGARKSVRGSTMQVANSTCLSRWRITSSQGTLFLTFMALFLSWVLGILPKL